jgi:hypothetical protein
MILGTNLLRPRSQVEETMDAAAMFQTMGRGCDGLGWD